MPINSHSVGPGRLQLISKQTLTGTATDITFSNLDLDEAGCYVLYISTDNATASASAIYLHFGTGGSVDSTATNYYREQLKAQGGAVSCNNGNNPAMITLQPNDSACCVIYILRGADSISRAICHGNGEMTTSCETWYTSVYWTNTGNVSDIQLHMSVASAFAIGTKVALYRMT